DDSAEQPLVRQPAGAETFAVAGPGGHDQRQILRMPRIDVALLQTHVERFRNAALNEAACGHDVVIPDERNGLIQSRDLVVRHGPELPPLSSFDFARGLPLVAAHSCGAWAQG